MKVNLGIVVGLCTTMLVAGNAGAEPATGNFSFERHTEDMPVSGTVCAETGLEDCSFSAGVSYNAPPGFSLDQARAVRESANHHPGLIYLGKLPATFDENRASLFLTNGCSPTEFSSCLNMQSLLQPSLELGSTETAIRARYGKTVDRTTSIRAQNLLSEPRGLRRRSIRP